MSATNCSIIILQQQTASNFILNSKDLKLLDSRVNRKTCKITLIISYLPLAAFHLPFRIIFWWERFYRTCPLCNGFSWTACHLKESDTCTYKINIYTSQVRNIDEQSNIKEKFKGVQQIVLIDKTFSPSFNY